MFTGIVEELGEVLDMRQDGSNIHFAIATSFTHELQVDQSIAHDGVCLTVTELHQNSFTVCAVQETLDRTALTTWKPGRKVNLERAMKMDARLDGHIVQGHVDSVGKCTSIEEKDGSWIFTFSHEATPNNLTVEKGSICINGVSLTVVVSGSAHFSVAIIPYTFEHTTFKQLQVGDPVNLEFDVIGKYVAKMMAGR